MWAVLTTFVFLLVGQYATHAGVSVLHAKEPTKLHLNESKVANHTNQSDARETMFLTRDRKYENFWRTEDGELVKLVRMDESSLQIERKIQLLNDVPALYTQANIEDGVDARLASSSHTSSPHSSSHRQKRTFWPFTSLFGYDYYPPAYGPPMLGPMGPIGPRPPFGGFGPTYLPPPPPFFGLEFSMGL